MNRVKAARPEMAAIGAKVLVILKVPFERDDEGLELADGEQGGDHKQCAGGKGGGGVELGSHGLNLL